MLPKELHISQNHSEGVFCGEYVQGWMPVTPHLAACVRRCVYYVLVCVVRVCMRALCVYVCTCALFWLPGVIFGILSNKED